MVRWYWIFITALAIFAFLTAPIAVAPVWGSLLIVVTGAIAVCIWFLLLFGPAEPLHGQ